MFPTHVPSGISGYLMPWRFLVIPLPKPGKDHTDRLNYRPIALTSYLCKAMERMVIDCLVWMLESTGIISDYQCGFRKNRSTLDPFVRFESIH